MWPQMTQMTQIRTAIKEWANSRHVRRAQLLWFTPVIPSLVLSATSASSSAKCLFCLCDDLGTKDKSLAADDADDADKGNALKRAISQFTRCPRGHVILQRGLHEIDRNWKNNCIETNKDLRSTRV